jgi:hypothetical protein
MGSIEECEPQSIGPSAPDGDPKVELGNDQSERTGRGPIERNGTLMNGQGSGSEPQQVTGAASPPGPDLGYSEPWTGGVKKIRRPGSGYIEILTCRVSCSTLSASLRKKTYYEEAKNDP